jgi:hypothetical protein
MAATPPHQLAQYLEDDSFDETSDTESLASLETDDGEDHTPERILAQFQRPNDRVWYLIKWQDCPVIRSSWESKEIIASCPWLLDAWFIEKQRQAEGSSKPLDIHAFNKAVFDAEVAAQQRRVLRRLKRRFNRVLSIVAAT